VAKKNAAAALPLVRTWTCPRCRFTYKRLAAQGKKAPVRCGIHRVAMVDRGVRRELIGLARLAQELIDDRTRLSEEFHDPLRAWEVSHLARSAGLDVPAWASSYFERVERRMMDRSIALSEGRKPDSTLAKALELDGHGAGAVSEKRAALQRQQQYVVDVIEVMSKGYTQSKAINALLDVFHSEDRGRDRRTIERALRDYKRKGWRVAGGRGGGVPLLPSEAARHVKAP
jgi:hypothetical protein